MGGKQGLKLGRLPNRHFLASSLPNQRNLRGIWIYLCFWRYLYLFIHLSGQIIATKPPSSFFCWFRKGNPPNIPEQINPGFGELFRHLPRFGCPASKKKMIQYIGSWRSPPILSRCYISQCPFPYISTSLCSNVLQ